MIPPTISAITLDLDDTLWPVWPAIEHAEQQLHDWLSIHAPLLARAVDVAGLRRLRDQVSVERPEWAHDFTAVRIESLRRGLMQYGHDPALAASAFDVFFEARHQVKMYPDVLEALQRLALRFPILALTNGNADLRRIGLSSWFKGSINAKQTGVGKPHRDIFMCACSQLAQPPKQVLHVGDDLDLDVAGALAAGLHAAWVCREDTAHAHRHPPSGVKTLSNLSELADWLGC